MPISKKMLNGFVNFVQNTNIAYDEVAKTRFKKEGMAILREVAKRMGLLHAQYDVRWNAGGIAVSGDIILHTDTLYVNLMQSAIGSDMGFMFRACNGRKDYTGMTNHWMKFDHFTDLESVARVFNAVAAAGASIRRNKLARG
jgi:hypothetical protein